MKFAVLQTVVACVSTSALLGHNANLGFPRRKCQDIILRPHIDFFCLESGIFGVLEDVRLYSICPKDTAMVLHGWNTV